MTTLPLQTITNQKKRYLPLLLDADPEEAMIDRYLEQGELFCYGDKAHPLCLAVVCPYTPPDGSISIAAGPYYELKNLVTHPEHRRQGLGSAMLTSLCIRYAAPQAVIFVGTSQKGVSFYQRNGFRPSHIVHDFFLSQYRQPIYEDGQLCTDMYYLYRLLADFTITKATREQNLQKNIYNIEGKVDSSPNIR